MVLTEESTRCPQAGVALPRAVTGADAVRLLGSRSRREDCKQRATTNWHWPPTKPLPIGWNTSTSPPTAIFPHYRIADSGHHLEDLAGGRALGAEGGGRRRVPARIAAVAGAVVARGSAPHVRATRGAAGAAGSGTLRPEPIPVPEAEKIRSCGRGAFRGDSGAGNGRSRCGCGGEPASGREVRGADVVPVRTEAVREADGGRHFAGRLASRRRLWGSFAQETPRAAAGQPYFGAEVRCAACKSRQERRRRGGDGADFAAEAPRGSRRFDFCSELRRSCNAQADIGAEASRGYWWFDSGSQSRRRGIGGADFDGEVSCRVRQIYSGSGTTRGLATRSGLLQLRRPAYRAALRLTLLPGARPHRSGRAGRFCGAGKLEAPLCGSSPLPARSPAALRAAGLGDVSKVAAPEIGSAHDMFLVGAPQVLTTILANRPRWWRTRRGRRVWPLRTAMRRRHLAPRSMIFCRFRRSHPQATPQAVGC